MGFFKKVFRPIRKVAKKIIPKEVRPFLPYIAAGFGPAGLAGTKFATMNPAFQKAILAGVTSAATDEQGNPLRAAALAAAPDVISGGLGNIAGRIDPNLIADSDSFVQVGDMAAKTAGALSRASEGIKGANALKTIGAQTAIDQSAKFAEIRQDEIDEYNRSLQEQGVLDKTKRRTAIFNIYKNAGYEDDYVNSMLDRYGYAMGGRIGLANGGYRGKAEAAMGLTTMKDLLKGKTKAPIIEIDEDKEVVLGEDDDDDDRPIIREKPNYAQAMKDAMTGVEAAFGIPFAGVEAAEFKRFARGGEVEIEEQVDDLGIMDLMKDQGIPYGEQASYGFDDAMGETFEMFLDYKKKGTIPMEMEFDEFLELLQGRKEQGIKGTQVASAPNNFAELNMLAIDLFGRPYDQLSDGEQETLMDFIGSKSQAGGEGIMQMASGYKSDIEEMYEQYVFEMEEQGLEPMDFASFLRQARSGMANGGKVKRRKKGEPADEVIETEEEIFLDKMPRPKRKGIMEAAGGGSVGSRYSFLINKQKQGILSPDEEQELLMLEMTYADDSQGKAEGGRVNMKVGGILKAGMQGLSKLKNMVVNKLSRMTDDVELKGSSDYADDTGASFELQVTAKSKKGKKTLDSLVEEGVVEKLDDNTYFISDANRDSISGMKGLKASGMLDEGAETFTRFDEGAGMGPYDTPYAGYDEVIETFKKADGGIMNKNLLNTGMDKDMRGGGFIPEGTKEKADDVPARLSKNEFVMTADAVRAAGGGSVNKGAKKMYDLMYTLEAKV